MYKNIPKKQVFLKQMFGYYKFYLKQMLLQTSYF